LGPADLLQLATEFEGHPDNAAAALLGGFTIAWMEGDRARAVSLAPATDLRVRVLVPAHELATERARALLPGLVPHADAAFNAARSGLLTHAITRDPAWLLPATADRLHQDQRAEAMPATLAAVRRLREAGLAAVVSGAGPSVLVLGQASEDNADMAFDSTLLRNANEWSLVSPGIDFEGAQVID
jgi:homoserine kinase